MLLEGSVISSSFTAILRISQAVYELKAVGEQTRDLLNTTKYVDTQIKHAKLLRHQRSSLLNATEKEWIDDQIEFTRKAVEDVAILIEPARVDMQVKNKTGNEESFKTRHIKLHHRASFVLRDSPKVVTSLSKINMAMSGLQTAMGTLTLCARENRGHLSPTQPGLGFHPGRRSTSPSRTCPPPYAEIDFINRRKTLAGVQRKNVSDQVATTREKSLEPSQPAAEENYLRPRGSWTSSVNFTFTPNDEPIPDEAPACVPVPGSNIRDSIGSDDYFSPTADHPIEMNTSAHPPLFSHDSEPIISHLKISPGPVLPPKPFTYQTQPQRAHVPTYNPSVFKTYDDYAIEEEADDNYLQKYTERVPWAERVTQQSQVQVHFDIPQFNTTPASRSITPQPSVPLAQPQIQSRSYLDVSKPPPQSPTQFNTPLPTSRSQSDTGKFSATQKQAEFQPLSASQTNPLPQHQLQSNSQLQPQSPTQFSTPFPISTSTNHPFPTQSQSKPLPELPTSTSPLNTYNHTHPLYPSPSTASFHSATPSISSLTTATTSSSSNIPTSLPKSRGRMWMEHRANEAAAGLPILSRSFSAQPQPQAQLSQYSQLSSGNVTPTSMHAQTQTGSQTFIPYSPDSVGVYRRDLPGAWPAGR